MGSPEISMDPWSKKKYWEENNYPILHLHCVALWWCFAMEAAMYLMTTFEKI